MNSFTLNWKGWWLLRPSMSDVPELQARCAVFAVLGARLKKVGRGIGSAGRELVMFGVHKGDEPLRNHLHELQKKSMGVFITRRCKEIRKHPTVYVAALPEDTDLGDLGSILSVIYESVPFAPKHHAMPETYQGPPFRLLNRGRNVGLPPEIVKGWDDPDHTQDDSDRTHDAEIHAAMASAIAADAQATRRLSEAEMDPHGVSTEKVPHPEDHDAQIPTEKVQKPLTLIETERLAKDDIPQGIETERVPKPPGASSDDTEFVSHPDDDEAQILDEASRKAT